MEKTQTSESSDVVEFDLKHRITGAAVLLFFGALVLPWLLGPPSVASKAEGVDGAKSSLLSDGEIEAVDLNGGELQDEIEIAETVYISKITPLDAQSDEQLVSAANKAAEVPAKEVDKPVVQQEVKPKVVEQASSTASDSKPAVSDSQVAAEKKRELAEAEKAAQQKKEAELAKAKENKQRREKEQREKELQAQVAAESDGGATKASAVDVGWVVQVGLFTEKSRALALVSELKNKGFTASNSVVDTNRGPKTGTRVWLGPFAKRSAAQTEQKRLKSKAGKDGFIRVYP